ncbi:MAG TPA: site-specific integrase [Acidimicrobiales bacterium]|nr:site-specific integrase [Acidimicrobiales bacterium]
MLAHFDYEERFDLADLYGRVVSVIDDADDPTATKFLAALATDPNKRRRLMIELLARTGMRAGELAALASDAMVRIGDTRWLRIPVGKLHNDRYVPLHPLLVELMNDWLATRPPSRSGRLVERYDGKPFEEWVRSFRLLTPV